MYTNQLKFSLVRQVSLLFLALASCAAFAYDPGDYSTWMQLKGNSGAYMGSVWVDPTDETQTAVPAEAGKCYYVPVGNRRLRRARQMPFRAMRWRLQVG